MNKLATPPFRRILEPLPSSLLPFVQVCTSLGVRCPSLGARVPSDSGMVAESRSSCLTPPCQHLGQVGPLMESRSGLRSIQRGGSQVDTWEPKASFQW